MELRGEIRWAKNTMVHDRVLLGNIVNLVGQTGFPKVSELCLGGVAAKPKGFSCLSI